MNERKPGAALLVTLFVVTAVLLYPVTAGPAVWLASRGRIERTKVEWAYVPVFWLVYHGPAPVQRSIHWWCEFGIPSEVGILFLVPTSDDEKVGVYFGRLTFGGGWIRKGVMRAPAGPIRPEHPARFKIPGDP